MDKIEILAQIQREYDLWYAYIKPVRDLYRARLLKRLPATKWKGKIININMISNYMDTLIASFFDNWVKVKFVSRNWWIWEEEAQNLQAVAEIDEREWIYQQVKYQVEQDSLFFGVWLENKTGFDKTKKMNTYKAINPLSWIPDPLPTQTGQFDGQNYRFHWFNMITNVLDIKEKYNKEAINNYFRTQYNSDSEVTRKTYENKDWTWPIDVETLSKNFSIEIYTHYTIVDKKKYKFVLSADLKEIFFQEELKAVTKEEKLDPTLVPRPIIPNFFDPSRGKPFGNSVCDKVEDKQNYKSIVANLMLAKAKKEALWWDFLVNSRLIKNKDAFNKSTFDTRYFFLDEEAVDSNTRLQDAMMELPQSQIKTDVYNMINFVEKEAKEDLKIDQLQQWLVPDKQMTKSEAQQIQSNANMWLTLKNAIKSWFYQEHYFQRWRWYLENFKDWEEKFALLNADYERAGTTFKRDDFITKQSPYIIVWSNDDILAITNQQKTYLNTLYPIITSDPETPKVSKNIFKRLVYKINWLKPNIINWICPYSASERQAKSYVDQINLWHKPKTILSNPNADFFTYWLYIQKCDDSDLKDKILQVLNDILMDQWMDWQQQMMTWNPMASSASNIMMSQNMQQQWWQPALSRQDALPTN